MIQNFDENLGRLQKRLDQDNLRENTLLIFMSDNGTAQGASEQDRGAYSVEFTRIRPSEVPQRR